MSWPAERATWANLDPKESDWEDPSRNGSDTRTVAASYPITHSVASNIVSTPEPTVIAKLTNERYPDVLSTSDRH